MNNETPRPKRGLHPLSLRSHLVEIRGGKDVIAHATAFGYASDPESSGLRADWLITNWHVVTGKNPFAPPENAPFLTHLSVHAHEPSGRGSFGPLGTLAVDVPLFDDDCQPTWFEHPSMFTDVVALPIETVLASDIQIIVEGRETMRFPRSDPTRYAFPPINKYADDAVLDNVAPEVGQVAFIVGFPFGDKSPTRPTPIWKAATIASELRYPWRSRPDGAAAVAPEPFFFVDTASRPGMSGAPVVREWMTGDGPIHSWFGVYSGRYGKERIAPKDWNGTPEELAAHLYKAAFNAQLGIVWPHNLVQEIVEGGVRGSTTHPWKRNIDADYLRL